MSKAIMMLLLLLLLSVRVSSQEIKSDEHKILVDSAIILVIDSFIILNDDNKDDKIYFVDNKFEKFDLANFKPYANIMTIDVKAKENKALLRNGIRVLKIDTNLKGDLIHVSLLDFIVRYKKKVYLFGNNGGANIFFQYSCEEAKWKLVKIEYISL